MDKNLPAIIMVERYPVEGGSGFIGLDQALFPWLHRPRDLISSGSMSPGSTRSGVTPTHSSTIIVSSGSLPWGNPRILVFPTL